MKFPSGNMGKRVTFWQKARDYPPVLVRILAIHRRRAISHDEIAKRSGLTPLTVQLISGQTSWQSIDLPTMHAYLIGCGLDFCDRARMKRVTVYLARQRKAGKLGWKYLRHHRDWETIYEPLVKLWLESIARK